MQRQTILNQVKVKCTQEYFKVNTSGTEFLVRQCEQCSISSFLFVSSIAVRYPDITRYYYAQSKLKAEEIVRGCSLAYTILRPSIVLGKDSFAWQSFAKLAQKPAIILFGDGKTRIQPILVDDLVRCITLVINENIFNNDIYELGGSEVIEIKQFLKMIHKRHGEQKPRLIKIPFSLLVPILTMLENIVPSIIPVNVGQLSAFRYDSEVKDNVLISRCSPEIKNIAEIFDFVFCSEAQHRRTKELSSEMGKFSQYFVNALPTSYTITKYEDGHAAAGLFPYGSTGSVDKFLLKLAKLNSICLRLVDIYCRFYYKSAILRKKLTLSLSLLENCSEYHRQLDTTSYSNRFSFCFGITAQALYSSILLVVSTLLVGPLHIAFNIGSKLRKDL